MHRRGVYQTTLSSLLAFTPLSACFSPPDTLVPTERPDADVANPNNDSSVLPDSGNNDGAVPPETVGWRSGLRLGVRWIEVEGGERFAASMFDRELDATCRFFETAAGEFRCLPTETNANLQFFADANCTDALHAQRHNGCNTQTPPRYLLKNPVCGEYARVYRIGPVFSGTPVFARSGDSCVQWPNLETFTLYRFGEELTASLVRASTHETIGGRIRETWINAEDGSRSLLKYVDSELDVECTLPENTNTCAPVGVLAAQEYSDAACAEARPAVNVPSSFVCDGVTRTAPIAALRDDSCAMHYWSLGDALDRPSLPYQRIGLGASCSPVLANSTSFALAAELQAAMVTQVEGRGDGPVQQVVGIFEDKSEIKAWLQDKTFGAACSFQPHSSLGYLCLPTSPLSVGYYFADSACTQAAVLGDGCKQGRFAFQYPENGCREDGQYFRLNGAPLGESSIFQSVNGQCVSAPVPRGYVAYLVGEAIATDSFPRGQAVVE